MGKGRKNRGIGENKAEERSIKKERQRKEFFYKDPVFYLVNTINNGMLTCPP